MEIFLIILIFSYPILLAILIFLTFYVYSLRKKLKTIEKIKGINNDTDYNS